MIVKSDVFKDTNIQVNTHGKMFNI